MAGGKGGSTSTTVEVPQYIEDAAKFNLRQAGALDQAGIAQIGYVPYYGADVAAFRPLQEASMQNLAGTAGAFGLATPAGGPMAGMPTAQTFAGGVRGYSSAPMFEEALDELGRRRPAQKALIDSFFIDPLSGQYTPITPVAPIEPVAPVAPTTPSAPSAPVVPPRPTITADPRPVTSVQDVIDARPTLPPSVLPPVVPAVGGTDPQVGDVIDNAVIQQQQNEVVVDAFDRFGDVMKDPTLTPEQVAAANPAFNPEIAIAAQDVPVTITTPTGEYTKPAGELTSTDFVAATGGEISTTATEPNMGGLPDFTGGTGGDVAETMEQYDLAGKSVAAAGVRNIGGSYAQSPAGSGELVETVYDPETGKSTIVGTEATPTAYDGSFEKSKAVADILKDQYGWSDDKLASQGYEGYGKPEEKTLIQTVTDPIVDLITPAPSDFETTYEAGVAAAGSDPVGMQVPTKKQKDFATTALADTSSVMPPIVPSSGDVDLPGNVITRTLNIGAGRRDDSSDTGYAGEADDGCVIATHAVSSGGFTPSMKREAVVWCMNVLHDKWWGEAIRRGYRHLGRKKIEQGKAHEHYAEFRDYIAFANGKKRTLKSAFNFTFRTAQFFAVGLVKKDA